MSLKTLKQITDKCFFTDMLYKTVCSSTKSIQIQMYTHIKSLYMFLKGNCTKLIYQAWFSINRICNMLMYFISFSIFYFIWDPSSSYLTFSYGVVSFALSGSETAETRAANCESPRRTFVVNSSSLSWKILEKWHMCRKLAHCVNYQGKYIHWWHVNRIGNAQRYKCVFSSIFSLFLK